MDETKPVHRRADQLGGPSTFGCRTWIRPSHQRRSASSRTGRNCGGAPPGREPSVALECARRRSGAALGVLPAIGRGGTGVQGTEWDLAIRPRYHQTDERIEAHIFVAFMAYCLQVTLKQRQRSLSPVLTPRSVLDKMAAIQMVDVQLPTTDVAPSYCHDTRNRRWIRSSCSNG